MSEASSASDARSPAALAWVLAVAAQVALLTWVVYRFRLESRGFLHLLILTGFGSLIHAVLPRRLRLGFFLLLSWAGLVLVPGWVNAAVIVVAGIRLVGLGHLSAGGRVAALVMVAALLAALRALGFGPPAV